MKMAWMDVTVSQQKEQNTEGSLQISQQSLGQTLTG